MNMEAIKAYLQLRQALKENGVIGVNVWGDDIHLGYEAIVKLPNLKVQHQEHDRFPYAVSTVFEGIHFHACLSEEEIRKHPELVAAFLEVKESA